MSVETMTDLTCDGCWGLVQPRDQRARFSAGAFVKAADARRDAKRAGWERRRCVTPGGDLYLFDACPECVAADVRVPYFLLSEFGAVTA